MRKSHNTRALDHIKRYLSAFYGLKDALFCHRSHFIQKDFRFCLVGSQVKESILIIKKKVNNEQAATSRQFH